MLRYVADNDKIIPIDVNRMFLWRSAWNILV